MRRRGRCDGEQFLVPVLGKFYVVNDQIASPIGKRVVHRGIRRGYHGDASDGELTTLISLTKPPSGSRQLYMIPTP